MPVLVVPESLCFGLEIGSQTSPQYKTASMPPRIPQRDFAAPGLSDFAHPSGTQHNRAWPTARRCSIHLMGDALVISAIQTRAAGEKHPPKKTKKKNEPKPAA